MSTVATLEPRSLWKHFDTILQIPRGSRQEDRIRDYVIGTARERGLEFAADRVGNLIVRKPAAPGREDAQVTILQSHLDMVNEKNQDVHHDFAVDPIRPRIEGDYLSATGTTLGADNGIGVAAMLAIMEDRDLDHGPLELLFTVDEETGLTGASQLDDTLLQGRRLLNLDTEEEATLYVGCAGGGDGRLALDLGWVDPDPTTHTLRLEIRGLRGGHSGVDIHLQRANAIRLLARLLAAAAGPHMRLVSFTGGNMRNAIPREATALVNLPEAEGPDFQERLRTHFQDARTAFAHADPDIRLDFTASTDRPDRVMDRDSTWKALHLLLALPHGVEAMSLDIPDLVETSTNLAVARTDDGRLTIQTNTRSSVASELEALRQRIRAAGLLAGADVELEPAYPGWKPNLDSPLLAITREVFSRHLGRDPEVKAVHAGLETGIIGEKVPGMDMISLGPQIEFPHSPDERVRISSVETFYHLLQQLLQRLAA